MDDYFKQVYKALKDFHDWDGKTTKLKPIYMLIKVDVDADIIRSNADANFYVQKHCDNNEYALVDWYYPDDEQFPYIAK